MRVGRRIGEIALGAFMRERFGAPYWVVHRADLQRILLDAVRSSPDVRLVMGAHGRANASDGASAADLTLRRRGRAQRNACTSTPSSARTASGRRSATPSATSSRPPIRGYVAWRGDDRPAMARRTHFAATRPGLWLGRDGHVVHYPIAGGRLVNIVAIERRRSRSRAGRRRATAPSCSPASTGRARAAGRSSRHRTNGSCGPSSTARRRVLSRAGGSPSSATPPIPVLPFLAQGAALAIEDAAALACLLRSRPLVPLSVRTRRSA